MKITFNNGRDQAADGVMNKGGVGTFAYSFGVEPSVLVADDVASGALMATNDDEHRYAAGMSGLRSKSRRWTAASRPRGVRIFSSRRTEGRMIVAGKGVSSVGDCGSVVCGYRH
jgi:hypothetical protein